VFVAAALVCAAGCRFGFGGVPVDDAGAAADGGADDLGAPADLAAVDLAPAPPDLALAFCAQPSVMACYQFEDGAAATVARDGSANRNDLTLTTASEAGGGHAGDALSIGAGGIAHAAHSASLDAQQITYEMWIEPTTLPATGARAGLVDEDGEYGLFIYAPGVLTCTLANVSVSTAANTIVTGAWQHVACSYDGATVRLYYNGALLTSAANTQAVASGQTNGLSIGSNSPSGDDFAGLVDDVRILSVARSAGDLCSDANRSGC
jgi:hypothetical protein